MNRTKNMRMVLEVLAENAQGSVQPGLMATAFLAEKIGLPENETKQLLRTLDQKGVIQSNIEVDFSLITHEGLVSLRM